MIAQVAVERKQDVDLKSDVNGSDGADSDVQNTTEFETVACIQDDDLSSEGALLNSDVEKTAEFQRIKREEDDDESLNIDEPKTPEFKIPCTEKQPERREKDNCPGNDRNATPNEKLGVGQKRKAEQTEELESKKQKQSENNS